MNPSDIVNGFRKRAGLSICEFAHRLNVTLPEAVDIVSGSTPNDDALENLAALFNQPFHFWKLVYSKPSEQRTRALTQIMELVRIGRMFKQCKNS